MSNFLIVCGGTGGHLAPGIAVATELQNRGHNCSLVVSYKQVDRRLLQKYPYLEYIRMPGTYFSWKPWQFIKFIFLFCSGLSYSLRFLPRFSPDVVIGFGGFTTVSIGLVSRVLGYPLVLHEANRKAGKTTKLLRGLARRIYLPKGMSRDGFAFRTVKNIGYPLREEMYPLPKREAKEALGFIADQPLLLVLGGSQGASSLNDWIEENIEEIGALGVGMVVITGMGKGKDRIYKTKDMEKDFLVAQFMQFTDEMPLLLSAADLVVCRAGAGTLAELIACQVPSIMVPYPHAADNHQLANAVFHEKQGAGVVVEESNIDMLTEEVKRLIYNPKLLYRMRKNLERLGLQNARVELVEDLERDFSDKRVAKKSGHTPPFVKTSLSELSQSKTVGGAGSEKKRVMKLASSHSQSKVIKIAKKSPTDPDE